MPLPCCVLRQRALLAFVVGIAAVMQFDGAGAAPSTSVPVACIDNSFSVDGTPVGTILADGAAKAALDREFPGKADSILAYGEKNQTLRDIQKAGAEFLTDTKLAALDIKFAALNMATRMPSGDRKIAPRGSKLIMAITHHVGTFKGHPISYTATVEEHLLVDGSGKPAASVFTIAYVRDRVTKSSQRPVLFLFNGGPGASSSPLHMSALGPFRRVAGAFPGAPRTWVENHDSPLDAADLVFIDPVGTGFSRAFPGTNAQACYTSLGDAHEVKWVIEQWLKENHRESSPRYLVGESYGTQRAALILRESNDLPFNGALLIALIGDAPGHEMPYVTSLPTMAAGAWYHNRIDRRGRNLAVFFDQAVEFARTDYVSALIRGSSLSPSDEQRIAQKISEFIGLPADLIVRDHLRVSKTDYMFNLLKDKGLRTGLLDVRVTARLAPGQIGALDDPALGVVSQSKSDSQKTRAPITPASIGPVQSPEVAAYMREVLGVRNDEPYYGINFSVNAQWKFDGPRDTVADLAAKMRQDRGLRLFWAAGYYDLTAPAYEGRYTLNQDRVPSDQMTAKYFPGPHGVYQGASNLAAFTTALREFVTAK